MSRGKKSGKSRGHTEVVPATIQVPLAPIFDETSDTARSLKGLKATEFRSAPTNITEAEIARVELSDKFRQRHISGDMHALDASEFFSLLWRERARFENFLAWVAERRRAQSVRGG